MEMQHLFTIVLTSAGVSGLVTFLLKTYFKAKIENSYKIELEKIKSDLSIRLSEERDLAARRIQGYPLLVELVYRTRNMARDLSITFSSTQMSLAEEFTTRACELEENLYQFRRDLEKDGLFANVHMYKNATKNFNMKLSDIRYFIDNNQTESAEHEKNALKDMYSKIEGLHLVVIHELSGS